MRTVEVMLVFHQANAVWSGGFFKKDLTVCFSGTLDPGNRIMLVTTWLNAGVGLTWLILGIGRVLRCCEQDGKKPVCRAKVPFGNLSCHDS